MPGKATSSRCSLAARLLAEDGEFGVVNSGGEVNGAADGTRTRDPGVTGRYSNRLNYRCA